MNFDLFGLQSSGFMITIALTMLMSGVIIYYCNSRFVTLERGLQRQNQVLAEFIANVQNEFRRGGANEPIQTLPSGPVINELATNEAINAAETQYASNMHATDKIEISDDDSSSSDDDDDISSSDESDDENENENENDKEVCTSKQDCLSHTLETHEDMDIKIIAMQSDITLSDITQIIENSNNHSINHSNNNSNNYSNLLASMSSSEQLTHTEPIITEIKDLETISSDDDYTDNFSDDETSTAAAVAESASAVTTTVIKTENEKKDAFEILNATQVPEINLDFKKMSVIALRELLIERGLSSTQDARKMKKSVLIETLSK